MVGRRGPAQAAFTTPGARGARRARRRRRDRRSRRARGRGADGHELRAQSAGAARYAARTPSGKPKRLVLRFSARRRRSSGRTRSRRSSSSGTRSTTRSAPCRPVSRSWSSAASSFAASATAASSCRAVPFDVAERHDSERARPRLAGRLRRGLDQARPERRHRHEQEGRVGDGRAPARGPARRTAQGAERSGDRRVPPRPAASASCSNPGWTTIDELERTAGEKLGRPRVKLCTWDALLEAAENAAASTLES